MKNITYIRLIIKIGVIISLALTIGKRSLSQNSTENKEIYGFSYNYETSRILKDRMFVKGNYTIGRRSFEVGISMNSLKTNRQGFLFQHRIFLNKMQNKHSDFNLEDYIIKTYAIYKFVMFGSPVNSLRKNYDVIENERITQNSLTSPGITTLEHYLGFGIEFGLNDNLSVEAMGVGGVNFIKNNSKAIVIEDQILPKTDLYLSWDISIGVNYRF